LLSLLSGLLQLPPIGLLIADSELFSASVSPTFFTLRPVPDFAANVDPATDYSFRSLLFPFRGFCLYLARYLFLPSSFIFFPLFRIRIRYCRSLKDERHFLLNVITPRRSALAASDYFVYIELRRIALTEGRSHICYCRALTELFLRHDSAKQISRFESEFRSADHAWKPTFLP
jgi:hypothetical protein